MQIFPILTWCCGWAYYCLTLSLLSFCSKKTFVLQLRWVWLILCSSSSVSWISSTWWVSMAISVNLRTEFSGGNISLGAQCRQTLKHTFKSFPSQQNTKPVSFDRMRSRIFKYIGLLILFNLLNKDTFFKFFKLGWFEFWNYIFKTPK